MQPALHDPSSQRTLPLFRIEFAYRLRSEDTEGRLAALEVTIPPGTLIKPHQHSKEDECTVVLSGQVGARIGDRTYEKILAGSSIVKPRGVPHAMWNVADEPARILELITPAGLEQYFVELAPILSNHGPEWTKRFYELATRYGLTILDDWSDELKARYQISL